MDQDKNRSFLGRRLEALRDHHCVTWKELAKILDISRSMLDFVRVGVRDPGPKVLRKIIEAERAAGLSAAGQTGLKSFPIGSDAEAAGGMTAPRFASEATQGKQAAAFVAEEGLRKAKPESPDMAVRLPASFDVVHVSTHGRADPGPAEPGRWRARGFGFVPLDGTPEAKPEAPATKADLERLAAILVERTESVRSELLRAANLDRLSRELAEVKESLRQVRVQLKLRGVGKKAGAD